MSYIEEINENGDCIIYSEVKPLDKDTIYVQDIPAMLIPEFQKLQWDGEKLVVITNYEGLYNAIYEKLLNVYRETITITDIDYYLTLITR